MVNENPWFGDNPEQSTVPVGETPEQTIPTNPLAGGAVVMPSVMSLSSGSTTTKPGRPQDIQAIGQAERTADIRTGELGQTTSAIEKLQGEFDTQTKYWEDQYKQYQSSWGDKAKKVYGDLERTSTDLKASREALSNMRINPDALVERMPTWSKALFMIGAMVDGFAAGYNKTKPTFLPALEKAIDRDIDVQQANFNAKLKQTELTAQERNNLWNMFNAASNQQKEYSYRLSQLALSKIGQQSKYINAKKLVADSIYDISNKLSGFKHGEFVASQDTKTKTGGSHQVLVKPEIIPPAKPGKGEEEMKPGQGSVEKAAQLINATNLMIEAKNLYKTSKPVSGAGWLGGDTALYQARLEDAIGAKKYYVTGAAATPQEQEQIRKQIGSGATPLPWIGESYELGIKKFDKEIDALVNDLSNRVRMFPQLIKAVPPSLQKQVLMKVRGETVPEKKNNY